MIFETHAHYDDEAFDGVREELIERLPSCGISAVVNVGASLHSSKTTLELAKRHSHVFAAIGVHPDESKELSEEGLVWLREQARLPKTVAIGEIGLDYHWDNSPREVQQYWFRRQIALAKEVGLPIIIHSRDAAQDTMQIVKDTAAGNCGGVVHCYSYSVEQAKEYMDMGFFIGIGGVVTFKNAKKLKEVVQAAPLSKLVLETDSPYLAPVPHRGERNDSGNLHYVSEMIAQLKGVTPEDVERITYENALTLYPKAAKQLQAVISRRE